MNEEKEEKIRHLEMIQQIITRMSVNSFYLKGWTVTLVTALLIYKSTQTSGYFDLLIFSMPVIIFWVLDSFYLMQERLFRKLYNEIREETNNFNMSLKIRENKCKVFCESFKSLTIIFFYLPLLSLVNVFTLLNIIL